MQLFTKNISLWSCSCTTSSLDNQLIQEQCSLMAKQANFDHPQNNQKHKNTKNYSCRNSNTNNLTIKIQKNQNKMVNQPTVNSFKMVRNINPHINFHRLAKNDTIEQTKVNFGRPLNRFHMNNQNVSKHGQINVFKKPSDNIIKTKFTYSSPQTDHITYNLKKQECSQSQTNYTSKQKNSIIDNNLAFGSKIMRPNSLNINSLHFSNKYPQNTLNFQSNIVFPIRIVKTVSNLEPSNNQTGEKYSNDVQQIICQQPIQIHSKQLTIHSKQSSFSSDFRNQQIHQRSQNLSQIMKENNNSSKESENSEDIDRLDEEELRDIVGDSYKTNIVRKETRRKSTSICHILKQDDFQFHPIQKNKDTADLGTPHKKYFDKIRRTNTIESISSSSELASNVDIKFMQNFRAGGLLRLF